MPRIFSRLSKSPPSHGEACYQSEAEVVVDYLDNAFQLALTTALMWHGFGSETGTTLFLAGVQSAVACRLAGPCRLLLGMFPFERRPSTGMVLSLVHERHHHLSLPFLLLMFVDSLSCATLLEYQLLCLTLTGVSALTALYKALRPLADLACKQKIHKLSGNPEFVRLQLDFFYLFLYAFARLFVFLDQGWPLCTRFCRGASEGHRAGPDEDTMCVVNLAALLSYALFTAFELSETLSMLNASYFTGDDGGGGGGGGGSEEEQEVQCPLCDELSICHACAEKMTGIALNYRPRHRGTGGETESPGESGRPGEGAWDAAVAQEAPGRRFAT